MEEREHIEMMSSDSPEGWLVIGHERVKGVGEINTVSKPGV